MTTYQFGQPNAGIVLIQPVDDHDLSMLEREMETIRGQTDAEFQLIAYKVEDWNTDLSPWPAPPVFGKTGFGDGAERTLKEIMTLTEDRSRRYFIGGYSLAGLFSLWAAYQTDVFEGVAAASPSVWFPGFADYIKEHAILTDRVYLSLGDKEEKTKNPVMATVGVRIREAYEWFQHQGIRSTLEWNPGSHFKDADIRTGRAFAWLIGGSDPFSL